MCLDWSLKHERMDPFENLFLCYLNALVFCGVCRQCVDSLVEECYMLLCFEFFNCENMS